MKQIMTPREAAQYLSLDVRTIYRLAKDEKLRGIRLADIGDSAKMLWKMVAYEFYLRDERARGILLGYYRREEGNQKE